MSVTSTGVTYDYEAEGGGTPTVFIHAGVADRRMWDPQWAALSGERSVLRLDLRGFGDSTTAPNGALSHVADVISTLTEVGIDQCHLVAASLGAGVAAEVALTAPERIRSMLLCPPGGSLLAELTDDLRAFFDAEKTALAAGDLDAAVTANIDTWLVGPGRTSDDVDPAVVSKVRAMQRQAFEIAAAWGDVDEIELDPPALDRLGEIEVPVLLLVGRFDLATTHDCAERVQAGIPDVHRVDWDDVAHLPSVERPDRFLDLLRDWLAKNEGTSGRRPPRPARRRSSKMTTGPNEAPWIRDFDALHQRRSAKWTSFPPDVLPMHVAEMDVDLAEPIRDTLHHALTMSDTGYAGDPSPLVDAFAGFTARRWGWTPERRMIRMCADVAAGVTEILRLLVRPGDRVVTMPPVYPPVNAWIAAAGALPEAVPLRTDAEHPGSIDLAGVTAALERGARAVLLCHPHNPTGRVHPCEELVELAAIAKSAGAVVLSDEIHAPLTRTDRSFAPFLSVSADAEEVGIAFHSASKAWNLAGLKTALIVAGQGGPQENVLNRLPHEVPWSAGHFGMLASVAAFQSGDNWLDRLVRAIDTNVSVLRGALEVELPAIRWVTPDAGYLAWLDLRPLELGPDPAQWMLDWARVATSPGSVFGLHGAGHVRMNIGCHPAQIESAVERMGRELSRGKPSPAS